ncbi:MAG: aminotransferase class I/II-fold pyridoxal phosphate-dependent enzyme [Planctomycetota bacterium]|jgi:histidinol-phosphate/aromatic aminotransferase/cobyric acid decarboxylase-like protein|nr:aminotransferase class I/II-fold pyridoxal phosphate-dependent enzyme [Planctomycetota bacterium]
MSRDEGDAGSRLKVGVSIRAQMDKAYPHGGDVRGLAARLGVAAGDILDFSANINPYGPPEGWRAAALRALENPERYPDPECRDLRKLIAGKYGSSPERIVVANGASEALDAAARALCRGRAGRRGVVPAPSYSDYLQACLKAGAGDGTRTLRFMLPGERGFALDLPALLAAAPEGSFAVIGRPNNPTALDPGYDAVVAAAEARPDMDFIVDESFLDFIPGAISVAAARLDNIIAVHSLTKFYSIPALRAGFVDAAPAICARVALELPCWSVNAVAMRVAEHSLRDDGFAARSRRLVAGDRAQLAGILGSLPGLAVFPSVVNFLLLRLTGVAVPDAHRLARRLLENHRIAIRAFGGREGLDKSYFRVAVRSGDDNERLGVALSRELCGTTGAGDEPRAPDLDAIYGMPGC